MTTPFAMNADALANVPDASAVDEAARQYKVFAQRASVGLDDTVDAWRALAAETPTRRRSPVTPSARSMVRAVRCR